MQGFPDGMFVDFCSRNFVGSDSDLVTAFVLD
jgi:hypothetical protein